MGKDELDKGVEELREGRKPEELVGAGGLLEDLTKRLCERALEGELTAHLGYEKHAPEGRNRRNSRNGKSTKRLKTETGELELEIELCSEVVDRQPEAAGLRG